MKKRRRMRPRVKGFIVSETRAFRMTPWTWAPSRLFPMRS
ncbi:unnamed protein product [Dibothriocephalus latus]|uniref:Uncharacterized protein n=1 Tax=Dibothriocephalus latus TaxID=60516 RepID=A0A3P6Q7F0_DIBLA|nr:unnamed protein product [Dibothriocephalus latus]